jgi:vacuolar-type H+-ATPase subunit I/STV1
VVDAPTATIIAAMIAGICSITVALISTSVRGAETRRKRGLRKQTQPVSVYASVSEALFGRLSRTRRLVFASTLGLGLGLLASSFTLFIAARDFTIGALVLLIPKLVIVGILLGIAYVAQSRRLPQSN